MISVMLSEAKHLMRFFATLRMTKGDKHNTVIAPFRGLGVD